MIELTSTYSRIPARKCILDINGAGLINKIPNELWQRCWQSLLLPKILTIISSAGKQTEISNRADVGERKRPTRQVGWSELASNAELHKSTQLNSDLEHAQRLHFLHVRHDKPGWRIHRKSDVVRRLQMSPEPMQDWSTDWGLTALSAQQGYVVP